MRALVIANGDWPSRELVEEYAAAVDLVVAADGGADVALALGLRPGLVVGDLDSISPEARAEFEPTALVEDADPDHTDLEKAVGVCIERGATRVDIVAAMGGRADHALANLSVLLVFRDRADVRVVDDLFEVRVVKGEEVVEAPEGTVVSLVAIGECEGVTTQGLRWDLEGKRLTFSPFGVHNEVRVSPARISVERGDLLLFEGRWVERHR